MADNTIITAAVLVIGDEILSGRTKDTNSGYIAEFLTNIGIDLKEVRVVSDDMDVIVDAVRALSSQYTYVFSTGGIGPTHDDITADAMATAFEVGIEHNKDAIAIMLAKYPEGVELNEARMRMARIPLGASLILNKVSAPPGFNIGNVYVMAGVPSVMRAMLDEVGPTLSVGEVVHSRTQPFYKGEGTIAAGLGALQARYDDISIGSYPMKRDGRFMTNIVMRGRDQARLADAEKELATLIEELGGTAP
ncbi:MAG: molybdopterin-binding protein [Hyphomicrobiales bacterium]